MAEPTEQIQTSIPSWLKDPILKLIGQADVLSQQGYQPYARPRLDKEGKPVLDAQGRPVMDPIQRVEGFNPLQLQAFQNIAGMQTADQLNQATGLAGLAGLDAARLAQYTPYANAQNFYESPAFREMQTQFERVGARPDTRFQMQGPQDITAREYTAPQMGDFERVASTYNYTPERVAAYQYAKLAMDPAERVRAERLKEYRMGPAALVGTEKFGLGAMQEYMSPYMQGVVERQKQAATQDYLRQLPGLGAAAARAGAKGGTREALIESEARRNLATQLGDIEAGGLQRAYEQSAGQFERDRAASMQAQLANQAAIQDVARQNLQAAMGIQSLGAGQSLEAQRLNQAMGLTVGQQNLAAEQARQQFMGQQSLQSQLANQQAFQRSAEFKAQQEMQAALANQQAGLTTGQQNLGASLQTQGLNAQQAMEAARLNQAAGLQTGQTNLQALINQSQFGAGQGLQAQQMNQAAQLQAQQQALAQLAQANQFSQQNAAQRAQYGLAGANLAEQSRQFGAGLGMQGLQQQLAAAGMLGNLGQQQYQQQMGINAAQLGAGGQQQALGQELLNVQYQDFLNQQRLPYQQLEFMSGILRGLPATGQTQTMYQQPGSLFGQIAGVGLGLGSLFGGLGTTTGGK